MNIERIKNDLVFRKMESRLKKKVKGNVLFQDPYHRYCRVIEMIESMDIDLNRKKVLELGCLRPELASLIKENFKCDITGIDQWNMMEEWGEYIEMDFHNADLSSDWDRLFGDETYDAVFSLEVIEHMIDTDAYLKRISKVLKKSGYLVLTTPNINSLRNRIQVPLGKYPAAMEYKNIIHHVRLYNQSALVSHLKEHGFSIKSLRGVNFLPYSTLMDNSLYRRISELFADWFPSLSSNLMVVASKD